MRKWFTMMILALMVAVGGAMAGCVDVGDGEDEPVVDIDTED